MISPLKVAYLYKQASKKKWIPKKLEEGALHKYFNIPEDEKIPTDLIDSKYKELQEKSKGDKKLNVKESKLFKRLHFAIVMRGRGRDCSRD